MSGSNKLGKSSAHLDKSFRDLLRIIRFMEDISTKIHGLLDKDEINRVVVQEFASSGHYDAYIALLTDDEMKLRYAAVSVGSAKTRLAEKLTGIQLAKYSIDVDKSAIYTRVLRNGETLQIKIVDVLSELFPKRLASLLTKAMGFEKTDSIATPLIVHGKIVGALAVTSTELAEEFSPSVRSLARHISVGYELADAHVDHMKMEEQTKGSEAKYSELFNNISSAVAIYEAREDGRFFVIKDINRVCENVEHINRNDVIGKRIDEVFPGVGEFGLLEVLRRVWQTGKSEHFPAALYEDDRISGWRDNRVYKLLSGEVVAVYDDVSGNKKAEAEIKALARLPDEDPNPVLRVLRDGTVFYANQASLFLLECWGAVVGQHLPDEWRNLVLRVLDSGLVQTTEVDCPGVTYSLTCAPVVSEGYVNLYGLDITERNKAKLELERSLNRLQKTMEDTIEAMATIIEMRDPYTAGHQRRVTELACAIARELGYKNEQFDAIRISSSIHDVGKVRVPSEILTKPGELTETEFTLIKIHPQAGYDILKTIEFPWPVAQIALQHHERLDGSGYPSGLKDKDILTEAKIVAVADVVEAMLSHRPYRPSLGQEKALQEVLDNRDILYQRDIVDTCVRLFTEERFRFSD